LLSDTGNQYCTHLITACWLVVVLTSTNRVVLVVVVPVTPTVRYQVLIPGTCEPTRHIFLLKYSIF